MTAIQHQGMRLVVKVFLYSLFITVVVLSIFGWLTKASEQLGWPWLILTVSLGGAALSIFFSLIVSRFVTHRIRDISHAMQSVSEGDLHAKATVGGSDEIGVLAEQFNEMARRIVKDQEGREALVQQIRDSVRKLSSASAGILKISNEQAANANEQASAVQEASTTSKEIAVTAKEITNNAVAVQNVAERATLASGNGAQSLSAAMSGMKALKRNVETLAERMVELGENSQKIGGVVNIIEEISEQTNLLALNAAIEAAGAGDAGKRFAVVAGEVRRLAEKTVDATKQIKDIIDKIQQATNNTIMVTEQGLKSVDSGYKLVQVVGQALKNIDEQVEQTTRAAKEITFSTQQQTSACEQMAITITEVSQVAEHFVQGTEETAETIAELNNLAAHLKGLIKS
ncbi:MAG: methyl-accepting chemotaxis protein [Planctomycetota bacterium]|nr:methyl-accepting chemotaxis protein [Planctomycetota bacterium]